MNSRDAGKETLPRHPPESFRSYVASQEQLSEHRSCLSLDGFCLVLRLPERFSKSALLYRDALEHASTRTRANTQPAFRRWSKGGKSSFDCNTASYIAYHHSVGYIHLSLIGGPFVCFPTKNFEVLAAGSILEFFDVRIVAGLGSASDEQIEKQDEG